MNPLLRQKIPSTIRALLTDIRPREQDHCSEWSDAEPATITRDGIELPARGSVSQTDFLSPAVDDGKECTSSNNARVEPRRSVCGVCLSQLSCYTCPRCNVPYCSLACYRSTNHSVCSEEFYKESVMRELKDTSETESEGRRRMQEILLRLRPAPDGAEEATCGTGEKEDVWDDAEGDETTQALVLLSRLAEIQSTGDGNPEEIQDILARLKEMGESGEGGADGDRNEGSEDEEKLDLVDRLSGLDVQTVSEEDLWERLTSQERERFLSLVKGGTAGALIPLWKPWWEEHEKGERGGGLVELLEESGDLEGGGSAGEGDVSAGEGDVSAGEGGVSAGEGGVSAGEGDVSAGEGGGSAGEGGVSAGEGDVSAGEGGVSAGEGGVSAGEGGVSAGEGGVSGREGGVSGREGGSCAGEVEETQAQKKVLYKSNRKPERQKVKWADNLSESGRQSATVEGDAPQNSKHNLGSSVPRSQATTAVPPINQNIPPLSSLSSKPSPLVCYGLVNVLFGYAFSLQLFNGDLEPDVIQEFCQTILAASETLSSGRVFSSVQESVEGGQAALLAGGYFEPEDPGAGDRAVEAVAHIMSGRSSQDALGYCLAALSDLRSALAQAKAALPKIGTNGETRRKYFLAAKKCEFFQAWVSASGQQVCRLAAELWREQRTRESRRRAMEGERKIVEGSWKKGRGKGLLIEEIC